MTPMYLINYIAAHPEFENIVILEEGDRTRMQAVERLSSNYEDEKERDWKINGTLEKNTLLIY